MPVSHTRPHRSSGNIAQGRVERIQELKSGDERLEMLLDTRDFVIAVREHGNRGYQHHTSL